MGLFTKYFNLWLTAIISSNNNTTLYFSRAAISIIAYGSQKGVFEPDKTKAIYVGLYWTRLK